jgi:hypothetical protein
VIFYEKILFSYKLPRNCEYKYHKSATDLTPISKFLAIKPIWTYGIQLWKAASTSNIEILEYFQSKALCLITDAPWYVPNAIIRRDLSPIRQRINSSPQRPVLFWTLHPSQPPSNSTLKAICFQKTEETPAI